MKIKFENIKWDTDGEEVALPEDVVLEVDNDLNPAYEGADVLSDKFGFCVEAFKFSRLVQKGQEVWFIDPDDHKSSGKYKVVDAPPEEEYFSDSLIALVNSFGSQIEAYAFELRFLDEASGEF